jgi:hypothetical protein
MKVALFKDITLNGATPFPAGEHFEGLREYARVSEYTEVEFRALSTETVVKCQLDALDRTEAEIRQQFQTRLDAINNRRAELQALTFVPA